MNGAECFGHEFNLARRENTSSTMVVQVQEQAFEIFSCDFSCDSSKICLKTVIFLFVSIVICTSELIGA